MKKVLNRLKNWIDTDRRGFIRTLLLSEGFGFCLCLSVIWGIRLDRYGSVSGWLIQSILLALIMGDIVSDILMLIWLWNREHQTLCSATPAQSADKASIRVWMMASGVIFICWLPVWLAYYPAVFAYDAETQLGQVISGMYSTHHPLLHTLIMGGCMKLMWRFGGINAGMALYAVLQMIVMALICGWLIAEAHRLGVKRSTLAIYVAFIALFPVHPVLAVSTTKDVIFSGLLAVCTLLVRRLCVASDGLISSTDAGETAYHRQNLVLTAVFTALMICFRNNALYAVIPVIIILVIACKKLADAGHIAVKYMVEALICGAVIGCVFNMGLKTLLHAESGSPREALSVPIQQMARVYSLHSDTLDSGSKDSLEKLMGGDVTYIYNEHLADPVKKQVYMKEPRLFIKTWLNLSAKYPGDYLDAWLYTTEGAWYLNDISSGRIYGIGTDTGFGYLSTDVRPMPYGFEASPHSYLPWLRDFLERLISDNAFERLPVIRYIFAPALYIWILIGCVHVYLVNKDAAGIITMLLPAAVFATILMGPAILVRYMYPYMLLAILAFIPSRGNICAVQDTF